MNIGDRILTFLSENPLSTARFIADSIDVPRPSVSAYLTKMFKSHTVTRSAKLPFAYNLPNLAAAEVPPGIVSIPLRKETKLADEQTVLFALAEENTNNNETLLHLLGWAPNRLGQTLDRLHSAGLIRTVHGSYVLISRGP